MLCSPHYGKRANMKLRILLLSILSLLTAGFITFLLKAQLFFALRDGAFLSMMIPGLLDIFQSELLVFINYFVISLFLLPFVISAAIGAMTMACILLIKKNSTIISNWLENAKSPSCL